MVWSEQLPFPLEVYDNDGNLVAIIDEDGVHVISNVNPSARIDINPSGDNPDYPTVPTISFSTDPDGIPSQITGFNTFGGNTALRITGEAGFNAETGEDVISALVMGENVTRLGLWERIGAQLTGELNGGFIEFYHDGFVIGFKDPNVIDDSTRLLINYASATGRIQVGRDFYLAGDSTWTAMSFQNGWSNLGFGFDNGTYMRKPFGVTMLRGVIIPGTKVDGTVIANLPAKYRPTAMKHLIASTDVAGYNAVLQVLANGDVKIYRMGAATALGLDGIIFDVN